MSYTDAIAGDNVRLTNENRRLRRRNAELETENERLRHLAAVESSRGDILHDMLDRVLVVFHFKEKNVSI